MRTIMNFIYSCLILGLGFVAVLLIVGCANDVQGENNTIHNESNINPSVGNNTIKLNSSGLRFDDSTNNRETTKSLYTVYLEGGE